MKVYSARSETLGSLKLLLKFSPKAKHWYRNRDGRKNLKIKTILEVGEMGGEKIQTTVIEQQ